MSSNELKEDEKVHHLRRCSPKSESEHHGVKVEGRSAVRSIQAETLKLANEYEEVRRSHIDGHTISLEDSRYVLCSFETFASIIFMTGCNSICAGFSVIWRMP